MKTYVVHNFFKTNLKKKLLNLKFQNKFKKFHSFYNKKYQKIIITVLQLNNP